MAEQCELIRADLSARADGERVDGIDEHVATCASCARFASDIERLRRELRYGPVDDAPDVTATVLARISERPRARVRWFAVAASFVAAALVGALFASSIGGDDIAAADLPRRVIEAQSTVASLAADVEVSEGPTTQTGTLRYRAPETLTLSIGTSTISTGDGSWRIEDAGGVTAATNVEPFSAAAPTPLDLVLPASAFVLAAEPPLLGEDGDTIGVRVTAAQVGGLLEGFSRLGIGRAVHPTDLVDLWLDRDHLVPVRVVVRAADGVDRERWAAARGFGARAGDTVLEIELHDVRVNDALSVDGLASPSTADATDEGFRPMGSSDWPSPAGMTPWVAGTVGTTSVATWTDGRAWIKVRSVRGWTGPRLFGGVGAVRRAELGDGVAYVADGGRAVAVHGTDVDLVVSGSVGPQRLRRFAAALGVRGVPVPSSWDEASVVDVDDLADGRTLPSDLGFAAPAVRTDSETVTLTFAGAGERLAVLTSRPGESLRPPIDPDAVGVVVRGVVARWSPRSHDLEWLEDGRAWSFRSETVTVAELVTLADALERT